MGTNTIASTNSFSQLHVASRRKSALIKLK
jgi:hypothetical protein